MQRRLNDIGGNCFAKCSITIYIKYSCRKFPTIFHANEVQRYVAYAMKNRNFLEHTKIQWKLSDEIKWLEIYLNLQVIQDGIIINSISYSILG